MFQTHTKHSQKRRRNKKVQVFCMYHGHVQTKTRQTGSCSNFVFGTGTEKMKYQNELKIILSFMNHL